MSTPDTSDNKRVLYLEQINVNATTKREFRIRLKIGHNDVELQQDGHTSTWTPFRSLKLSGTSNIALIIKSGPKRVPFGKQEAVAEVTVEEAMRAFWESNDSISRTITFDKLPAIITFEFRPSPTSETIRTAVQNLQAVIKDNKSLTPTSTEQRFDTAIKYGTALSKMNPFATAAFGAAKVTFDLLQEQRKYDEKVSDLASEIDRILPFAAQVLEGVLYDETELLEGAIRKLYGVIFDAAQFIAHYVKQNPASIFNKPTTSAEDQRKIHTLAREFGELRDDFGRAVDIAALKIARENAKSQSKVPAQIQQLTVVLDAADESRLLDRLKPVHAANYQEHHGCMENTRKAVLERIVSWAAAPLEQNSQPAPSQPTASHISNIFWLYGMPGIGKTSVANSLCDRLRSSRNLGGSFFCRRDDPIRHQPTGVLPTLISKLVAMWAPLRKLVAQALHDDPQLNPESTRGELLLGPLKLMEWHPPHHLVLVIDAFDECGEPGARRQLLNCLLKACSHAAWLKVFITSRPEYDIKDFFDKSGIAGLDLATDDQSETDISFFTHNRMSLVANRRYLRPDWPGVERLTQIVKRSGGLFIFVETLYRLVDCPDPDPLLAQVLDGKSEKVDGDLHKLYAMVITSRNSDNPEVFRSILHAIVAVAAYRPLRDETLAALIGLEPRIIRSWIDEVSSLLYRDQDKQGGIRVRHLSVLEFLVGPNCPAEFRVEVNHAHAELALCCMRIMKEELKFNICGLETSRLSNAEIEDLSDRVERKIPDALQYSCMHWPSHLCSGYTAVSTNASGLLEDFFVGSRPLHWLEVMSLLGEIPAALRAIRKIRGCTNKFDIGQMHILDDILRFVLAFYTPISTSAPHIYVSALPFMPTKSALWHNARKSFPGVFTVCEGRMKSWPAVSGIWNGHTDWVCSVACSPDGQHIVSGSKDSTIRIWDAETGAAVGEPLEGHTDCVNGVAYSPDGRHIVSGSDDSTIRIWDAETGAAVGEPLEGHTDCVNGVAYSPDGRHIVSSSDDSTIRIWDAETGAAVGEPLEGHTGGVSSVAYSPDGRHIVSGSWDRTIRIWDAETGAAVGEPLEGHTDWVNGVAYSPDGRHIVSGSWDRTIRIWDAETGAAVGEPLEGHTDCANGVAYSPDGRHIVSGSEDRTIRIWDAETGAAVGEPLEGHTDWVNGVAYSPDGRHIVSGSKDSTIRIWDAETGAAVGEPLEGHTGGVSSSPDGRQVVPGVGDDTIRIWDVKAAVDGNDRILLFSGSLLNGDFALASLSGRPIPTKMLESNGWMRGAEGLLLWVPEDCRNGLTCHSIVTIPITGRHRCVRLDFANFRCGTSWTEIYEGNTQRSRSHQ